MSIELKEYLKPIIYRLVWLLYVSFKNKFYISILFPKFIDSFDAFGKLRGKKNSTILIFQKHFVLSK